MNELKTAPVSNALKIPHEAISVCIWLRAKTFWSINCRLKFIIWPKQTGLDEIEAKMYTVIT